MIDVRGYFTAERQESALFVIIAFIFVLFSLYMLIKHKSVFTYGVVTALLTISLIQTVIGVTIFIRSPKDLARVELALRENNQNEIRRNELPRMAKVIKDFKNYATLEIALMILAIFLMFYTDKFGFWSGFGAGLFVQASIMLLLDFFAERRAEVYIEQLRGLFSV